MYPTLIAILPLMAATVVALTVLGGWVAAAGALPRLLGLEATALSSKGRALAVAADRPYDVKVFRAGGPIPAQVQAHRTEALPKLGAGFRVVALEAQALAY
ncbi:MAG TPA: hypothetical protein PLL92_09030 [Alicycliphilus sp.]|nr:hypothetical protein [Alicycliphilus sp.]